jgi:hypothetical protein
MIHDHQESFPGHPQISAERYVSRVMHNLMIKIHRHHAVRVAASRVAAR